MTKGALLLTAALSLSCYETAELKLHAVTARTTEGCFAIANRVFMDAGYARLYTSSGANLLFTPRVSPAARFGMGWGIAVWVNGNDGERGCAYDLEAMSVDPQSGGGVVLYSVQRGETYDRTVHEMARRLETAAD